MTVETIESVDYAPHDSNLSLEHNPQIWFGLYMSGTEQSRQILKGVVKRFLGSSASKEQIDREYLKFLKSFQDTVKTPENNVYISQGRFRASGDVQIPKDNFQMFKRLIQAADKSGNHEQKFWAREQAFKAFLAWVKDGPARALVIEEGNNMQDCKPLRNIMLRAARESIEYEPYSLPEWKPVLHY